MKSRYKNSEARETWFKHSDGCSLCHWSEEEKMCEKGKLLMAKYEEERTNSIFSKPAKDTK